MAKNKNKKAKVQIRSEPTPSVGLLTSVDFPGLMLPPGYTSLASNPEVKICVDKIADLVSNMTIHLMENTEKGDKRVKNELSKKIDVSPCSYMTRKSWMYKIVSDLLLHGDGNSVVYPVIKGGLIQDLLPLRMQAVGYEDAPDGYRVTYDGKTFAPDEVIHFVVNPDPIYPYRGTGYRISLREIVNNLRQATKTKNGFMSGQYMPNVVVKVDANSEEFADEASREQVKQRYLKDAKPGEPWIIPAELIDIQSIKPLTLEDIAINESVELDKKTVAGLLGVPAFFLGVGTFNKDEYNNFVDTRIMSIGNVIGQTLTRDLLYDPSWYFRLNPRSLYAYNLMDLTNAGTAMIKLNTMRRNELRDWVGLDPDEEMEDLLVLENFLKQEDLGKQNKLNGGDGNGEA
ncbi:MAG: phage portal protein [Lachnospiraceae bacterium]